MGRSATGVTVVCAGGIGCALGHALCAGGVDVNFVENDSTKLEWGRRNGVAEDQKPPLPAAFVDFREWQSLAEDPILLCTKCYDNGAVLERVPSSAVLIPIQNGFDPGLVGRVEVEGIASFVTECLPGRTHTRITRPGELHIGFSGTAEGRVLPARVDELIDALVRHGSFTVRRVPEVLPYEYTKLMYNAAISPVAAVAGLDNGQLLTVAKARTVFFGLLRENYRARQLQLPPARTRRRCQGAAESEGLQTGKAHRGGGTCSGAPLAGRAAGTDMRVADLA